MAEMKLQSLDFVRLLPRFMRDDAASKGLSAALNELIPTLAYAIGKLSTWDKVNEMSAAELDALAWELNILWYDQTASVGAKRDIVLNSDKVYKKLGTKWAVENVTKSYFGDGYVREWWEYDGDAGHFRVYSSNPSLSLEKINEYQAILDKVKRKTAIFDGVYIELTTAVTLCAGTAIHEGAREAYGIGYAPI